MLRRIAGWLGAEEDNGGFQFVGTEMQRLRETPFDARFRQTIEVMIARARARQCLVMTEFNSSTIIVDANSNPLLIHRDYLRSFVGDRKTKVVGPHPEPQLAGLEGHTAEEMATPAFWQLHYPRGHYRDPSCRHS